MFLFRGKNQKDSDVPKLPDTENPAQIQAFFKTMAYYLIKDWKITDEFNKAIEILTEQSEQHPEYFKEYLAENWEGILKNAVQNPELISAFLDVTQSYSEKNPWQFNHANYLLIFLDILKGDFESIDKHRVLETIRNISESSESILTAFACENKILLNVLQVFLMSPSDYLRNESLILLIKLSDGNDEVSKILTSQGIFENLLEIIKQEEGKIIEDCLELMIKLLSEYTKQFIRELRHLNERLKVLLGIKGKVVDKVIEFVKQACKDKAGKLIGNNLLFFSDMLYELSVIAFPQSTNEPQNCNAIELMTDLIQGNPNLLKSISNPNDRNLVELLESLPIYCLIGNSWKESFTLLWTLVKSSPDIQISILSKITCIPGYVKTDHKLPSFNYILNEWLEDNTNSDRLCKLLELLLYGNEISKELAANLPIDINSCTLLMKIFNIVLENILNNNAPKIIQYTRLLIVWLHKSAASCNKIRIEIDKNIELIFDYIQKETEISQCLCLCLIGIAGIYIDDGMVIPKLAIKKIGYTESCSLIDKIVQQKNFSKNEQKSELWLDDNLYSYCFYKEYRTAAQAVKKSLLTEITESAPESESELAKLVQAQDMLISNLQSLRKGGHSEELDQLANQVRLLNEEIVALRNELIKERIECEDLKTKNLEVKLEKRREVRGIFEAMVNLQDNNEVLNYQTSSLVRENKSLLALNERLREEIKTYTAKRPEIVGSIQMLEMKEKYKVLEAEIEYLRSQLELKDDQNKELLELVGKQNLKLESPHLNLSSFDLDSSNLNLTHQSVQTDVIPLDKPIEIDFSSQTEFPNPFKSTQTVKTCEIQAAFKLEILSKKRLQKNQNLQCGRERRLALEKIRPSVVCKSISSRLNVNYDLKIEKNKAINHKITQKREDIDEVVSKKDIDKGVKEIEIKEAVEKVQEITNKAIPHEVNQDIMEEIDIIESVATNNLKIVAVLPVIVTKSNEIPDKSSKVQETSYQNAQMYEAISLDEDLLMNPTYKNEKSSEKISFFEESLDQNEIFIENPLELTETKPDFSPKNDPDAPPLNFYTNPMKSAPINSTKDSSSIYVPRNYMKSDQKQTLSSTHLKSPFLAPLPKEERTPQKKPITESQDFKVPNPFDTKNPVTTNPWFDSKPQALDTAEDAVSFFDKLVPKSNFSNPFSF